jgi:GTP cyclohydrolase II
MEHSSMRVIPDWFARPDHVAVERGLAEFRAGRPVLLAAAGRLRLALPVDGIDARGLAAFTSLCAPAPARLLVSARRARALGIEASGPAEIVLAAGTDVATVRSLAADAHARWRTGYVPAGADAAAAVALAKLAHRLPALLIAGVEEAALAALGWPIVTVEADAIARHRASAIAALAIASEAQVPLHGAPQARFVVFRDATGGSPVAVIIGKPDPARPVPVRLHSACLTGDVFASRRCDCGDQLKLSIGRLKEAGGGVILYLEQEGRGLGLASKMRTYQLQEAGLDTVDANTTLGFDDDERDYGVAARMLEILGMTRVLLLTNNPLKLNSLAGDGIEIAGRLPLYAPIHADNRRYLTAKATRAGHRLDHLVAVLADGDAPLAVADREVKLAP